MSAAVEAIADAASAAHQAGALRRELGRAEQERDDAIVRALTHGATPEQLSEAGVEATVQYDALIAPELTALRQRVDAAFPEIFS